MRVICPECGAVYAVGAGMIPAGGRDVACSACRAEWRASPGEGSADAAAPGASGQTGQTVRSTVTPEVAGILRAEAAREQAARTAERETEGGTGGQSGRGPDGDLAAAIGEMVAREEAGGGRAAALAVPAAQLRPAAPPGGVGRAVPEPVPEPGARHGAGPGARHGAGHGAGPHPEPAQAAQAALGAAGPPVQARSGRGFRALFWTVVVIACALALAHVFAPRIAATVPAAAPAVAAYSEAVEGARSWVGDRWQELRGATGTTAPAAPAAPAEE